MNKAEVLITGGTGMIGSKLAERLVQAGFGVIILTRKLPGTSGNNNYKYALWDPEKGFIDEDALKQADAIIHLAGAGIADKRWSKKRKEEIVASRVGSGRLLARELNRVPNKVKVFLSASAIGWYGPDPNSPNSDPFTEKDAAADDFLGSTCQKWEESVLPVKNNGTRLVILRTGIVVSRTGGAYKEFAKPLKFRLATVFGGGRQVISWIHLDDLVNMYFQALISDNFSGIYNAVAPAPVTNRQLIIEMARQRKRRFVVVKIPAPALKLLLGELSIELLKSTTVSSEKAQREGFHFEFPTIESAVANLNE